METKYFISFALFIIKIGGNLGHIYFRNWVHLIWSTKNRYPYLSKELQDKLYSHIFIYSKKRELYLSAVDGYSDHIHILMNVNPKDSISSIVQLLKGESSHWINSEKLTNTHFSWQEGYAAFSVSESKCNIIVKYINDQKEHHKKISFLEEVNNLFALHKIECSFTGE